MKRIFAPIDFSICSYNGARIAGMIAQKTGAEVCLFHTINTPVDWLKVTLAEEAKYPEIQQKVAEAKRQLQEMVGSGLFEGVKVSWELHYNETILGVVDAAKASPTDLIVMGTHGTNSLGRMILGSNAQKVVRNAQCPVLTVNEASKNVSFKKIVVASEFASAKAVAPALHWALLLEKVFGASIMLLKVEGLLPDDGIPNGPWNSPLLAKHFAKKDVVGIGPFATIDETIIGYTKHHEADLTIVVSHQRHGLGQMVFGSISESVVNFSSVPVLVTQIPATEEEGEKIYADIFNDLKVE